MTIKVEISPGELVDKLTVLEIKLELISDEAKIHNIKYEYDHLLEIYHNEVAETKELGTLREQLKTVNIEVWHVVDRLHECEKDGNFSDRYIELARRAVSSNDDRALIKRRINEILESRIIEEKSFQ